MYSRVFLSRSGTRPGRLWIDWLTRERGESRIRRGAKKVEVCVTHRVVHQACAGDT